MQTERAKNQHYLFIYFGGGRGGGGGWCSRKLPDDGCQRISSTSLVISFPACHIYNFIFPYATQT